MRTRLEATDPAWFRLDTAIRRARYTGAEAAELLSISQTELSKIRNGHILPDDDFKRRAQKEFGIPRDVWPTWDTKETGHDRRRT